MELDTFSVHDTTVFLTQLAVVLVVARMAGALVRRLGQPAVLGHVGAGILLGPSILGSWDGVAARLFPEGQTGALVSAGVVGQVLVLATTGFHVEPALVQRWSRRAPALALGSLVLPLALGALLGHVLPASYRGDQAGPLTFVLFMAVALAISSPPVISRVLADQALLRRDFAQVSLAVAMSNDVVGWVLLSVVASLAGSGRVQVSTVAIALLSMAVFVTVSWRWGTRLATRALSVAERSSQPHGRVAIGVAIIVGAAAATNAAGVEAVLGAFVAGMVLRSVPGTQRDVQPSLQAVTDAWFGPLFFAIAGLRVDLAALADPVVLAWALGAVGIATVGKLAGAGLAARLSGSSAREAAAIAVTLNIRGSLEIVLATSGLALGVLNASSYTVVIFVAVATSAMAPPLLRAITRDWDGDRVEQARLRREGLLANVRSLPAASAVVADGVGGVGCRIARSIWPGELADTGAAERAVVLPLDDPPASMARHMQQGRTTLVLVSGKARIPSPDRGGTVVVPVTSTTSAAAAVEAAAAIALANSLPLRLVHVCRAGHPPLGIDAAARWATDAGVPTDTVVIDDPARKLRLVDVVTGHMGPDDLLVTGSSARPTGDETVLGSCATALRECETPAVVVVPPAASLFSVPVGADLSARGSVTQDGDGGGSRRRRNPAVR